jgi:hypothetical protein
MTTLEKVTNVSAAIMCVSITILAAARILPASSKRTNAEANAYVRGERIAALPATTFDRDRTLVLIVRSGCQHCTDSMAFYRRVVQVRNDTKAATRLMALTLDEPYLGEAYLHRHEVYVDKVEHLPLDIAKRVPGTPTVIALDRTGTIRGVWVGDLTASQQKEIETFVGGVVPLVP